MTTLPPRTCAASMILLALNEVQRENGLPTGDAPQPKTFKELVLQYSGSAIRSKHFDETLIDELLGLPVIELAEITIAGDY